VAPGFGEACLCGIIGHGDPEIQTQRLARCGARGSTPIAHNSELVELVSKLGLSRRLDAAEQFLQLLHERRDQ